MVTFKIDQSELISLFGHIYCIYTCELRVFVYPCYTSYILYIYALFHFNKKKDSEKKSSNMEEQTFELKALMEYNSAEEFFDSNRYMLIDLN